MQGADQRIQHYYFFDEKLREHSYIGVDISTAVEIAKKRFKERCIPGQFIQRSVTDFEDKIEDKSVDIIFSEGVLHHTDNTCDALCYLSRKLKDNGLFMFYVYKKKAPIREYSDDFIREAIQEMSDDDANKALMPLTKLGKVLGDLKK